ncbi:hypothetical protein BDN71DRAFT_1433936 [Pleurotus eryngii]|uniref:Uncharacterized protein n=1 Tax=Pleurotus eryngii TaxID=5323 RepID=A0A9P5ZQV3_PLEER|nr:hypothetical protein BDN71DRAFT_1433936 [Pleurotus eryngii]
MSRTTGQYSLQPWGTFKEPGHIDGQITTHMPQISPNVFPPGVYFNSDEHSDKQPRPNLESVRSFLPPSHLPLHVPLFDCGHFCTGYLTPLATFSSLWLHKPTTRAFNAILKNKKLVELVEQFCTTGQTDYSLLAQLLSHGSSLICNKYARSKDLVVFQNNHLCSPKYHPNDTEMGAPDLVGVLGAINRLLDGDNMAHIPWHHILTTIEEKGKADWKEEACQSGAYLEFVNQSRPDLVGMYRLSISPIGYIIQYSCPAGLQTSEVFCWSDLSPLVSYVCTLYVPHPDFATRDPSVNLVDNGDILSPPAWNICNSDKIYENCVVKVVGDPWHQMT